MKAGSREALFSQILCPLSFVLCRLSCLSLWHSEIMALWHYAIMELSAFNFIMPYGIMAQFHNLTIIKGGGSGRVSLV